MSGENILEVQNLTKHFKISGKQIVHAVDGVSFTLQKGKTLGLVGESGCGKSTCARTIIRMYDVTDGKILLDGTPREVFSHVALLKQVGLDVPQATLLAWELKKAGLDLPDGILTREELVEALCQLY